MFPQAIDRAGLEGRLNGATFVAAKMGEYFIVQMGNEL